MQVLLRKEKKLRRLMVLLGLLAATMLVASPVLALAAWTQ